MSVFAFNLFFLQARDQNHKVPTVSKMTMLHFGIQLSQPKEIHILSTVDFIDTSECIVEIKEGQAPTNFKDSLIQ